MSQGGSGSVTAPVASRLRRTISWETQWRQLDGLRTILARWPWRHPGERSRSSAGTQLPALQPFDKLLPLPRECLGPSLLLRERFVPGQDSYLVDSASSHMLVSKIKPCMSKYKQPIL